MESPFFKEYNERATIQAKLKTMEQEQVRNATDQKNLRETNAKLETENRQKREDIENLKKELKLLQERNQELIQSQLKKISNYFHLKIQIIGIMINFQKYLVI